MCAHAARRVLVVPSTQAAKGERPPSPPALPHSCTPKVDEENLIEACAAAHLRCTDRGGLQQPAWPARGWMSLEVSESRLDDAKFRIQLAVLAVLQFMAVGLDAWLSAGGVQAWLVMTRFTPCCCACDGMPLDWGRRPSPATVLCPAARTSCDPPSASAAVSCIADDLHVTLRFAR